MPKLTKQKLKDEGDAAHPAKERSFSKILAKDVKKLRSRQSAAGRIVVQ